MGVNTLRHWCTLVTLVLSTLKKVFMILGTVPASAYLVYFEICTLCFSLSRLNSLEVALSISSES